MIDTFTKPQLTREAKGVREQAGLNSYRMKGFGRQQSGSVRVETPTLSSMKAKQGAIVSKFMTFFQRKFTLL